MVTQIYNCSALNGGTYDVIEPATKLTVNPAPYCAELFNPRCGIQTLHAYNIPCGL
jgi:hypothetical protein